MSRTHKKMNYPSFDRHLARELRSKSFRKAYEEEYIRLATAYQIMRERRRRGLTQRALAKRLGTTQSAVARIEQGKQNLTVDMLAKIAKGLNRRLEIELVR